MRVLVTGAAGFVGSWLCHSLAGAGAEVVALLRRDPEPDGLFRRLGLDRHPGVRVQVGATDMAALLRGTGPDRLFHLAGQSQVGLALSDPAATFAANAGATWGLMEALRGLPACPATVVVSTDGVYGETPERPAVESDPLTALGPYEASKIAADVAARCFAATYGLPVAVARLGNTWGPGDANAARLVPALVRAIRAGDRPVLRGGGLAVRSYLHVSDAVAGLIRLADRAAGDGVRAEAFNLSGPEPMTTLTVATLALAAFGRPDLAPVVHPGAPGEISVKVSSSALARERLGWTPSVSLGDGLAALAADGMA